MDRRRVAAFVVLPFIVAFALRPTMSNLLRMRETPEEEAELTGKTRPRQIPPDWIGEPLPYGEGWRWSDPKDRSNAVRLHRGHLDAPNEVDRSMYVMVTVKGQLLNARGQPMGEFLRD